MANREEEVEVSCSGSYRRPLTVAVEGNIGSGKTTFLNYCKSKSSIEVVPEPIEEWQNFHRVNLLVSAGGKFKIEHIIQLIISQESFYQEPQKWAMAFQLHVNITMIKGYRAKTYKPIKLVERSLLSARCSSYSHLPFHFHSLKFNSQTLLRGKHAHFRRVRTSNGISSG